MPTTAAPFATWSSPITAASIVEGAATITEVVVDGDDVWWAEARPSEGGRTAVLRRRGATTAEVIPADANVRTRVHEYGGGAWWVSRGVLVYSEFADQQLRLIDAGRSDASPEQPRVLTTEAGARYADGRLSVDGRWYVCVREQHGADGSEAVNEVVAVATDASGEVRVLASGADFYACPRPSPDGAQLTWIQWNHPDMPWDGTELWIADLTDGRATNLRHVAGGRDESLQQPDWSPSGRLHVISDRSGWWNLYALDPPVPPGAGTAGTAQGDDSTAVLSAVRSGPFDIGGPMWVFGQSAYAFLVDRSGNESVVVDRDVSDLASDPTCLRARGARVVVAGGSWHHETQVAERAPDGSVAVLRAARDLGLDPAFFPAPEAVTFPTGSVADSGGADPGDDVAHALFYPPANPGFRGTDGERPPLLVFVHGGPTSAARRSLHLPMRYWTSRGFAVVDVDYRGSTGYGRAYRRSLDGRWGVADVEDAIAAARFLAGRGDVDPDRLLIRGGSAGGFTVLCALTFADAFAAGASHYGIADLEALATDTHKFESRYLDRLVGPYPEALDRYVARSPIHHTDRLRAPMIVLQGSDDQVVPPNQAEMMVEALAAKGVPHAYVLFAGEGHGFRRSENIIRALESELSFYAQMFGAAPADPIDPVPIQRHP